MAEKMQITRSDAVWVAMFVGFKLADKWPDVKLAERLRMAPEVVGADEPPPNRADLLKQVLSAAPVGFEIVAETAAKDDQADQAEVDKVEDKVPDEVDKVEDKTPDKAAAESVGTDQTDQAPEGKSESVPTNKKKREKKLSKSKPQTPQKFERVQACKSNAFVAGSVLRKHGLEKGITTEMLEEFFAAVGKRKEDQALLSMAQAWHALRGYNGLESE